MKKYFIGKLIFTMAVILGWGTIKNSVLSMLVTIILIADFTLVPLGYLVVGWIRKRKLFPGEYRVRPEGKRL